MFYQNWQREIERQPVEFLGRRITELLAAARAQPLRTWVSNPTQLSISNPTTALNMVARSLDLHPGDEILASDHEYGALDRSWRYICNKTGANYIRQPIPLPITSR
jgi:isopenicillin-N epimerase